MNPVAVMAALEFGGLRSVVEAINRSRRVASALARVGDGGDCNGETDELTSVGMVKFCRLTRAEEGAEEDRTCSMAVHCCDGSCRHYGDGLDREGAWYASFGSVCLDTVRDFHRDIRGSRRVP